jgi:hypothetical protein
MIKESQENVVHDSTSNTEAGIFQNQISLNENNDLPQMIATVVITTV